MEFKVGDEVVVTTGTFAGYVGQVKDTSSPHMVTITRPGGGLLVLPWKQIAARDDEPAPAPRIRAEILREAEQVITRDRQDQYGDAEDCFGDIAALWTTWKRVTFSAHDVAMMMALLKIARAKSSPSRRDNYVDLGGYGALAAELVDSPIDRLSEAKMGTTP